MTDYGKVNILGSATTLPATSALGLLLIENTHPILLVGFLAVSLVSLIITIAYINRYMINKRG